MRLKNMISEKSERLVTDVESRKESAETVCQYLTACNIPYEKNFRHDFSGADFLLKNFETASSVFKDLLNHRKIPYNFDIELDKSTNMIKVFFKE